MKKFHVELHRVKVVILQHVQRRVPRPEIIHPHLISHSPEFLDAKIQDGHIFIVDALGDLNMHHPAGNIAERGGILNLPDYVAKLKVQA